MYRYWEISIPVPFFRFLICISIPRQFAFKCKSGRPELQSKVFFHATWTESTFKSTLWLMQLPQISLHPTISLLNICLDGVARMQINIAQVKIKVSARFHQRSNQDENQHSHTGIKWKSVKQINKSRLIRSQVTFCCAAVRFGEPSAASAFWFWPTEMETQHSLLSL